MLLLCCLAIQTDRLAGQAWKTDTDTSYFRPGEDDWNLVESVLRSEPGNALLLLNRGADPDAVTEEGMTPLMAAAKSRDSLMVRLLVANGADLELTREQNTTPLLVSVLNQDFGIAHYLLQRGADPNHIDDLGGSPLIYAAALNDYPMADLLLYYGASDTLTDREGNTALMTAVFFGNVATADVLLQNGLSPDVPDRMGVTPLMVAAEQGDTALTGLLLDYGASLEKRDSNNYTALTHAILFGQPGTARQLILHGANVHHRVTPQRNLYDLAVLENRKELQGILKKAGASPTPRPDFSVFTAGWGNSFNGKEHLMQARFSLTDRKFGYFAETGFDWRPFYRKVQLTGEDPFTYQYREFRWVWTHGAGKYFRLLRDHSGVEYGIYGALYGMLSSGDYRGWKKGPGAHYSLVPAAGAYMQGRWAGLKAGTERYRFGTLHERAWKINITMYVRLTVRNPPPVYKAIIYE